MNITIYSFFVLVVVYAVASEIFTVLFRLTGLKPEKAKFQVVSMLTNSGFTTKESELIMVSSVRRRIAVVAMFFGYLFAITAVSLLVNFVGLLVTQRFAIEGFLYGSILLFVLFGLTRSQGFVGLFDRCVEFFAKKYTRSEGRNYMKVFDVMNDKLIAEIHIQDLPPALEGKTVAELDFRNRFGLNILLIRHNKETIDHIKAAQQIKVGDTVLLYGAHEQIQALFNCPS